MRHFPIFDVTPRFNDLEPSQMVDGLSGLSDRIADSAIMAFRGTANNLNHLVDFVLHDHPPKFCRPIPASALKRLAFRWRQNIPARVLVRLQFTFSDSLESIWANLAFESPRDLERAVSVFPSRQWDNLEARSDFERPLTEPVKVMHAYRLPQANAELITPDPTYRASHFRHRTPEKWRRSRLSTRASFNIRIQDVQKSGATQAMVLGDAPADAYECDLDLKLSSHAAYVSSST